MRYSVTPLKEINFGVTGIQEILQNVSFILSTMKFSCPMDREFGWEPELDAPIQLSQAVNTSRIIESLKINEPRVTVDEVKVTINPNDGKHEYKVVVSINE